MFFFSDHLHVASMSDSPLLDSGVETAVESNASNGLFNLESNTVESPVPEAYWTTLLILFCNMLTIDFLSCGLPALS